MSGSAEFVLWLVLLCCLLLSTCANRELCARKPNEDVDCSHLITHDDPANICTVKYYRTNSSGCSKLEFKSKNKEQHYLGDVRIRPYVWNYKNQNNYLYTLLNISFSDIRWTNIKFRFEAVNKVESELKNHCREITLYNDGSFSIPSLNYDCHWSDQDRRYENETFNFEFLAEDDTREYYGKYVFTVPSVVSVNKTNAAFIYINVTNLSNIYLHALSPKSDSIDHKYVMEVCRVVEGQKDNCKKLFNVSESNYQQPFNPEKSGLYYFQLISQNCNTTNCHRTVSPKIYISCNNIVYTILWKAALILSVFGTCFIIFQTIRRLRRHYTPSVLMLYSHIDNNHAQLINLLRKYMKSELHWNVMWDEEIELTDHSDPYLWCLDAFKKANCVLYFVKPASHCSYKGGNGENDNIHVNLEDIFLKVLKTATKKNKIDIYTVLIDSDVVSIPVEIQKCRRFHILEDWNMLLHSMLQNTFMERILRRLEPLENSFSGKEIISAFENHELFTK